MVLTGYLSAFALDIPPEIKLPPPPHINNVKVGAGFNMIQSETDSLQGHLKLDIDGKKGFNEWIVEMLGAYGEVDGEQSVGKANGSFQFNRLISGRAYYNIRTTVEHDSVRELSYRLQVSPGVGYYVVRNQEHSLALESGLMYRGEKQAGARKDEWGGRFAERYTYKFKTKSRFWYNTEITPEFEYYDYIVVSETGIETPLTKDVNIQLMARDVYDSAVENDAKKNEFILQASLVWSVM